MGKNWEFKLPTRVQFGRGSLRKMGETVGALGASVLLVGYRNRTGLEDVYGRAEKVLAEAGLAVATFYEVPPDPAAELGAEGSRAAKDAGAEVVVALGGGSVIDAAKGIAALAKMGGALWDYTGANPDGRPVTDSLPVVAVPTTAGTGSEVTAVAVFTHQGASSDADVPLKASISGPAVPPKVALVDPDLAVGSPPSLTAACGADALGHALEACLSRRANPISSTLGGRAVRLILENLRRAVENPDDPGPREPLALAATLAGAAFSEAGVVVTHAIAQALGGVLHVSHGVGVALGTPLNLRYNLTSATGPLAELADACGIAGGSPEARAAAVADAIVELLRAVGLPQHVDVPGGATDELVERLVRNARQSTPVPITLNPRKVTDDALRDMFRELVTKASS